ncbi:MAG: CsbD family protein [Paracoccus sp.]|uniref:CsbD family protein n=2 Tax=Paracoccus hibiscisoli TaxID=2023261 RepID=A0A4U0QMR8_9RHOB|nr:CsbD family protein [Paracoccus sp. (in: a-proteobacteria)]TJZ82770.1 CsbD family protein [Paracoccus hibiscisoli]
MGEMTDKAKAAGNKLAGSIKDGVGDLTGNERLQAEGKAQKAKGAAQDVSGTVKGKLGNDI